MFKTHRTFDLSTGVKSATLAVAYTRDILTVIYHQTAVVEFDGRALTLKDGGYDTVSTRIVINRALEQIPEFEGYSLSRVNGVTMLNTPMGNTEPFCGRIGIVSPRVSRNPLKLVR